MSLADLRNIAQFRTFTVFPFYPFTPRFCHLGILPFYPFTPRLCVLDILPFYLFAAPLQRKLRIQKTHREPAQLHLALAVGLGEVDYIDFLVTHMCVS